MPRLNEAGLCVLVRYAMVFTSVTFCSSFGFNLYRTLLLKRAARWSVKSHCAVDLALLAFFLDLGVYCALYF